MNVHRLGWTIAGVVCIAFVAATGARAWGENVRIVSPSSTENAEGDLNITPTAIPLRIQHLIPAADFADLPASHRLVVAFNFRSDESQTEPVDWTSGDEQVWMSTTDKDELTEVFDDNHGPDRILVHDGALSFPLLATGPPGGPRDIADGQRLETPFLYDPSKGNLLIDRLIPANNPSARATIDLQTTTQNLSLANSEDVNSPTGVLLMTPAVIQIEFEILPAPADFDGDGVVDGQDLALWKSSFRVNGDADADGDGDSDGADFLLWQRQLSIPQAASVAAAAPEPAGSTLIVGLAIAIPVLRIRSRSGE